jgi:predicted GTPase
VLRAASPVALQHGPQLSGKAVLVVEDGPTVTHGGMPFGAGTVAAQQQGARVQVDPRPFAVGSIAEAFARYPHIGPVLPAMGYSEEQLRELEATINATECDVVVTGTPIDLGRLIDSRHPIRRATYELQPLDPPALEELLAPFICASSK